MHALHVYSGNLYGGIESTLLTLARHQASQPAVKHEFALCFQGRLAGELARCGAVLHLLGPASASQPWTIWRARTRLRQLLRSRFDVVVLHSAWSQALFSACARSAGIPAVFWLHDAIAGTRWEERLARLNRPEIAICNSMFTENTLSRLYNGLRSEVLRYPVPQARTCEDREAVRSELRVGPNDVVIIQSSRMEAWKGHKLHLQALGKMRHMPNWICWMVGGPQRLKERAYLQELREYAGELGIDERVRWLGERPDIPRLLSAADIHCQPNTAPEPFGITFVEALSAGLPSVTTDMGGAAEIVTPDCGWLVPPGDSAALATALGTLIRDGSLRRRLGAGGPARAKSLCDLDTQLGRLAAILRASALTVCE